MAFAKETSTDNKKQQASMLPVLNLALTALVCILVIVFGAILLYRTGNGVTATTTSVAVAAAANASTANMSTVAPATSPIHYVVDVLNNYFEPAALTVPELSKMTFTFTKARHNVWSEADESFRSVSSRMSTNEAGTQWTSEFLISSVDYVCVPHETVGHVGKITVTPLSDEDFASRIFDISILRASGVIAAVNALQVCTIGAGTPLGTASADVADLPTVWTKLDLASGPDSVYNSQRVIAHLAELTKLTEQLLQLCLQVTGMEYSALMAAKGSTSEIKLLLPKTTVDVYTFYHELGEAIEHIPKILGAKLIQMTGESVGDAYNRMKYNYLKNATRVNWKLDVPEYPREYTDAATYGLLMDSVVDFVKGEGYSIAAEAACRETM